MERKVGDGGTSGERNDDGVCGNEGRKKKMEVTKVKRKIQYDGRRTTVKIKEEIKR